MVKNSFKVKEVKQEGRYWSLVLDTKTYLELEISRDDLEDVDLDSDMWVLLGFDEETGFVDFLGVQNKDFRQTKSKTLLIPKDECEFMFKPKGKGYLILRGGTVDISSELGNAMMFEISKDDIRITSTWRSTNEGRGGRYFVNLIYLGVSGGGFLFKGLKRGSKTYFSLLETSEIRSLLKGVDEDLPCLLEFEVKDENLIIHSIKGVEEQGYQKLTQNIRLPVTYQRANYYEGKSLLNMWFKNGHGISTPFKGTPPSNNTVPCEVGKDFRILGF